MESNSTITVTALHEKTRAWFLVLVCLIAFALRVWGISFGLPGVDHGDESEVVNHAVRFGSGDFNPHRFQYGALVQYILFVIYGLYYAIGFLAGQFLSVHQFAVQFVRDPSTFYLIARGLSALFGAATVAVTFLVGRRIKGNTVGLIAALFLTLSYQHVIHSHYATVDAALTFLFTCAVYRSLALLSDDRLPLYLYAGFFVGLAAGTKFNGLIALVAFAMAHFSRDSSTPFPNTLFSREWLLGLSAVIVGHFLACPYFYLDFSAAFNDIINLRDYHAFSGFNLLPYLQGYARDYWGIPAGALCAAGIVRYLVTRQAALRVLSFTALAVICFASLHRYVEAKYVLYAFPLGAVLGATFLMELVSPLKNTYRAFIVLLLLIHPLYLIVRWDAERMGKSITLTSKEWIEEHIPPEATILLDNAGNAGPKLANAPENVRRQYERAQAHELLKAEFLKLQLEVVPPVYYNIVEIDSASGSREDDYSRYRLWQDTDEIGHPPGYYCERGYDYIVVTQRYFTRLGEGFKLVKEFKQGKKGMRIYAVNCRF